MTSCLGVTKCASWGSGMSDFAGATAFIVSPPRDAAGWVTVLSRTDVPVLAATAASIDELRQNEDAVDAHLLAEALSNDPLMTLKLLRHVSSRRSSRLSSDAETVTEAVLMLGIPPFFNAFREMTTVESRLADLPDALDGVRGVLARSERAARFALAFAVHRMDHDAAVIHEAALLHDFAEVLLWVNAPSLALQIARRQAESPTLRSAEAQRSVLHVDLAEIQQALMKAWRLPELLVSISDDRASVSPKVRNVQLAIRVARHSMKGWENPAIPDDLQAISELLNLGAAHVRQLLLEIDG